MIAQELTYNTEQLQFNGPKTYFHKYLYIKYVTTTTTTNKMGKNNENLFSHDMQHAKQNKSFSYEKRNKKKIK